MNAKNIAQRLQSCGTDQKQMHDYIIFRVCLFRNFHSLDLSLSESAIAKEMSDGGGDAHFRRHVKTDVSALMIPPSIRPTLETPKG
jgi:hypothetical protein